jgi:hypothetical protein
MKKISNSQFEYDINIISNLNEVPPPNFFYTRLQARIEREKLTNELTVSMKPILVICALTLFLFINSIFLKNDSNLASTNTNQELETFAASYDQTISN